MKSTATQALRTYALGFVDALMFYARETEHLPIWQSLGGLLLPLLAIKIFCPGWAAVVIFAGLGLPLLWFLGSACVVSVAYCRHDRT